MDNKNAKNTEEILNLVEKFGFKFFGYDENSLSLVVAPNGQIVALNVAYEFVKAQMANAQSSGGPEAMPNMPIMPNNIEKNFETALEKESTIEKAQEKQTSTPIQAAPVANTSQAAVVAKKEEESPFGDGFKLPINPLYMDKVIEYVKKNSKKSLSSTSKWLSVQFEKFISEQDSAK